MKKRLLIYWFCIASASVYSQSVELKANNPMPRIGDNFYLNYEINPEKLELAKNIINTTSSGSTSTQAKNTSSPFKSCTDPDLTIAKGTISLTKKFEKEGNYNFGPFSFVIDGKSYKSDNLTISVYPELPKVRNGVWISYIKSDNDYYLIIEQRIEGNNQSLFSSSRPRLLEKDTVFVTIDDSLTKTGSEIIFMQQNSSMGMRNLDNDMKKTESQYTQKTTVYKVWMSEKYNNNFSLSRVHLLNLPTNNDFAPILMKR